MSGFQDWFIKIELRMRPNVKVMYHEMKENLLSKENMCEAHQKIVIFKGFILLIFLRLYRYLLGRGIFDLLRETINKGLLDTHIFFIGYRHTLGTEAQWNSLDPIPITIYLLTLNQQKRQFHAAPK